MDVFYFVVALAIMIIGLVGSFLPMIPGVPLIYAAYFIYGLGTGWRDFGWTTMVFFGGVTLFVLILDYIAGAWGARKFGASTAGVIGSIVGGILGVIFFNIFGMIAGIFGGAVLGELYRSRTTEEALRSGWGAVVGFLAGTIFKTLVGLAMIASFLVLIIF